ncbi:PPC domain-containing protein [Verrucomicrobiaceae bacterium 227]
MIRAIAILIASALCAAGFSPDLKLIEPRGGKRGSEVEIKLIGDRLFEPQELLLYHKGISVRSLEKSEGGKSAKAILVIAPDTELGEHPIRLRCKGGLSYMRTFWVGQFETVMEARTADNKSDTNNEFTEPQIINLNTTVQGVADREDADYYRVEAKKGQRLSVEVEGMRLGRVMFDPYVAILDKNRFELAVSDDSALLKRDCAACIIVPEDGPYTILVRESAYEGSGACQYRLHVGSFPRPSAIYPPAAKPNEEVEFTFIGDPGGDIKAKIKTPAESFSAFAQAGDTISPSGNPVQISPLDYLNESEPNEGSKEAIPTSNPPAAPFAFHGILSKKEDKDWFRFTAKKDQNLRVQVIARALRSPLDSVLLLRNAKDGKLLGSNDDQTNGTPDSRIDFKAPEDGEYLINIRDQLYRSGNNFVYRIEVIERSPEISLTLPSADRNDTQKNKMIEIPRGNRLAIAPNITRSNIGCDIVFHAPVLPKGVSVKTPPVSRSLGNFPILFEAGADAPIAGGLYPLEIEDPKTKLKGPFSETISHVYVNNQGDYQVTNTNQLSIAVIEEAPFHLDLFAPPVPIVRNGTMNLKVTARRAEGFTKKIKVTLPWKPAGIGAPNEVEIPEGKNEVILTINANGDAPVGDWQLLVNGESASDTGVVRVSSGFVDLKVSEPFLNITLQMAATNPGVDTSVIARIEQLQDFPGDARVILQALPHGVTSEERTINMKSAELTFPLKVTDEARKGKHANLFCQVIISKDGHPIPHNVGHGGTLRIDPPPPAPKKEEKAKEAPKVVAAPATKKPLSRLEQLRLQNSK